MDKKTKIIATIGPVSSDRETLTKMVKAGLNVIRLNMSHGDYAEQQERIDMIREISKELNVVNGILLDTKGPEVRTGLFETDHVMLEVGKKVIITMDDVVGTVDKFTVSYKGLASDVKVGDVILLDDGYVAVEVLEINGTDIVCEVLNSGKMKDRRGVNVPGVSLNFEFLSEKDKNDVIFACEQNLDYIAASFVRTAADVEEIRDVIRAQGNDNVQILSKIENQESVENIDEIIEASDGIMVARGDLGVEVPAEDVPVIQKMIIEKCNALGKIVITATQMLESMQDHPRPTRAEVSDVFNAVMDGTDSVMLSGESAAGKYPVESVETQGTIAARAETVFPYEEYLARQLKNVDPTITDLVAYSVVSTANVIDEIKLIIALTSSGTTAREISRLKPKCPILAVSSSPEALRGLVLNYAVIPALVSDNADSNVVIEEAIQIAIDKGLVEVGDEVVVSAGSQNRKGKTNLMRITEVK
ncbi:MAG: pyruvate kinase [Mycoplasmatales bacterium]